MGHFFSVSRLGFERAIKLGLNPALAYLVLARGTNHANCVTPWSVNAIENYTGMSRHNARAAIESLITNSLIHRIRGGTRPQYEFELGLSLKSAFSLKDLDMLEEARNFLYEDCGTPDVLTAEHAADRIVQDRMWLPNTLIDSAAGEFSPIALMSQARNEQVLHLFVHLYFLHQLEGCSGVPFNALCRKYSASKFAERAEFLIWEFNEEQIEYDPSAFRNVLGFENSIKPEANTALFGALGQLLELGLLQEVTYLINGKGREAEILHAVHGGEPIEQDLADVLQTVASHVLPEFGEGECFSSSASFCIPVLRHLRNIELIAGFRLMYRPHTTATGAWWNKTQERCQKWKASYLKLEERF